MGGRSRARLRSQSMMVSDSDWDRWAEERQQEQLMRELEGLRSDLSTLEKISLLRAADQTNSGVTVESVREPVESLEENDAFQTALILSMQEPIDPLDLTSGRGCFYGPGDIS